MSASRSVAAAQRRRAGPTPDTRGPATSINSSQAFSQPPNIRPGTSARVAGQQAALAQQQQQQQQLQQNASASKSQLTVPQAITLITLRLGRIETQLQNLDLQALAENGDAGVGVDNNLLERLESLEKIVMETNVSALKQQIDIIKPAVVSVKNMSTSTTKEVKELKALVEELKTELVNTQNQLQYYIESQNMLLEQNEQGVESQFILESEEVQGVEDVTVDMLASDNELSNLTGANLKEIIEQELFAAEA